MGKTGHAGHIGILLVARERIIHKPQEIAVRHKIILQNDHGTIALYDLRHTLDHVSGKPVIFLPRNQRHFEKAARLRHVVADFLYFAPIRLFFCRVGEHEQFRVLRQFIFRQRFYGASGVLRSVVGK